MFPIVITLGPQRRSPAWNRHQKAVTENVNTSSAGPEIPQVAGSTGSARDHPAELGTSTPPTTMRSVLRKLRRPLPVAPPRSHLEMPVEQEDPEIAAKGNDGAAQFGAPGPRISVQHPLYAGFMGAVGVGLALLVYWIGANNTQLLLWIVTALFISLGLDPVVRWLETRKVPRPAGILLAVVILASAIAGSIATLIPTIVAQVTQIVTQGPEWVRNFTDSEFFRSVDDQFAIRNRINEELDKFVNNPEAIGGIFGGVVGFGSTVANGLFGTLIVLVLSLYFLAAMPAMKRAAYRLAPRSRRQRVEALSEEITRSVGNYVIGQGCVALLNATFAFILMSILGVPFTVLLAFVVVMLAFIPLVGGLIAAVLVILVAFTQGWQTASIYAICYFAYLQFEAYFISPRIMQKAVAVPGAVAVISVIAGSSLLGVLGALIAIPTAAAVLLLVEELYIARQDKH